MIHVTGNTVNVDMEYPRSSPNAVRYVQVGVTDVRAIDDIRVSYDFDRDGWSIEQQSVFQWEPDDTVCDPGWKEVAFVKAWSLEKPQ